MKLARKLITKIQVHVEAVVLMQWVTIIIAAFYTGALVSCINIQQRYGLQLAYYCPPGQTVMWAAMWAGATFALSIICCIITNKAIVRFTRVVLTGVFLFGVLFVIVALITYWYGESERWIEIAIKITAMASIYIYILRHKERRYLEPAE